MSESNGGFKNLRRITEVESLRQRTSHSFTANGHAGLIRIAFELNVANLEKIFTKH